MIGLGLARVEPCVAQSGHEARPEAGSVSPSPPGAEDARATLRDAGASPEERRAAACLLLASDEPGVRALLHRAVIEDDPPGTRRAIAEAVATMEAPPAFLEPALASSVEDAPAEDLAWLLPPLRGYQSRSAVGSVISLLRRTPPLPQPVLRDVFRTLAAQTGLAVADAPEAWLEWWAAHEGARPAEWYRMIASGQARRARAIDAARERLSSDVERLYREVHALTPVAERSPLIADLIRSDRRLLASIGFDLARRALLNARPLGPEVVEAAASRLADPDVTIRRDAANLLDRIDPADIGPRATIALRSETDPEAAGALLRIVSRQPEAGANQATVRWARTPGPARSAALSAGVALLGRGYLKDPAAIDEIARVALGEIDAGAPSVAGVRFLAATGHVDRCVELLGLENREVALVAAEAVGASASLHPRLLEAARAHADLYASAASAIRTHLPSAEGLGTLLGLPAPSPEERMGAAASVACALPPRELLDAAREIEDRALLIACLGHVPTIEFMSRPDDAPARQELLRMLLRARLAQEDPEGVLEDLAVIQDQVDTAPFASARVGALLRLGRIEDAEQAVGAADVPASEWIDALAESATQPFAGELAARVRTRFADHLTEQQRQRLDQITATIPAAPTEPPEAESASDAGPDDIPSAIGRGA